MTSKGFGRIVLMLAAVRVFSAADITLHDKALVKGRDILLADIATVSSSDPALKQELLTLKVGQAALPGYNLNITIEKIRACYLAPFYLKGEEITLKGGREVRVTTDSRTLEEVSLREAVRDRIMEKCPWPKDQMQLTLESVPAKVVIENRDWTLEVNPSAECDWRGSEPMQVRIMNDGQELRHFPVTVRIRLFGEVCVAENKLKRGSVLSESDLRIETREITDFDGKPCKVMADLMGKTLARTVLAGAILKEEHIEIPPMVKRGERVRIMAREKTALVAVEGIASQDGRMGDRIHVRNTLTNRVIEVFVCGEGQVGLTPVNGGVL